MVANYLATDLDRRTTVAGVKAARAIARSAAMRPFIEREVKPGPEVASDEALLAFCRDTGATIFHPTGTCKMGNDRMAVLDERLRVRGIERLRVVDCSAMPTLISGNTNAPAVMLAEKAADMIREDARR
jgi:choline dehydrogenase